MKDHSSSETRIRWTTDEAKAIASQAVDILKNRTNRINVLALFKKAQLILPPTRRRTIDGWTRIARSRIVVEEFVKLSGGVELINAKQMISPLKKVEEPVKQDVEEDVSPVAEEAPEVVEVSAPRSPLQEGMKALREALECFEFELASREQRITALERKLEDQGRMIADLYEERTSPDFRKLPVSHQETLTFPPRGGLNGKPVVCKLRIAVSGIFARQFRRLEEEFKQDVEMVFVDPQKSPTFTFGRNSLDAFICGLSTSHKVTDRAISQLGRENVIVAQGYQSAVKREIEKLVGAMAF